MRSNKEMRTDIGRGLDGRRGICETWWTGVPSTTNMDSEFHVFASQSNSQGRCRGRQRGMEMPSLAFPAVGVAHARRREAKLRHTLIGPETLEDVGS